VLKWIVVPFTTAYAPGDKKFDIDINQVSYKAERTAAADLSDGYYTLNQSIVALKANGLAAVTSIAGMKGFKFGAQSGTTSLDTINNVIAPTAAAQVYNTNDDAIAGLKAKQPPYVWYSSYQEGKIRNFHRNYDRALGLSDAQNT